MNNKKQLLQLKNPIYRKIMKKKAVDDFMNTLKNFDQNKMVKDITRKDVEKIIGVKLDKFLDMLGNIS